MKDMRKRDWVMLMLGIWFVFSPFFLGYRDYTGIVAVNSYVFGAIVAALAGAALYRPQMWEEWVELVLGLWLIVAPFALDFRGDTWATANHIMVGLLIAADAASVLVDFPTHKLISK